jgi:hypothetical protein
MMEQHNLQLSHKKGGISTLAMREGIFVKIEVPMASPVYEGLESKVTFLLGTGFDRKLLKPFFNKDSVISFCTTEVAEVSEKNNNIGIQSDNFIGFLCTAVGLDTTSLMGVSSKLWEGPG